MRARNSFNTLRHQKVLVTAGPTREHWDPVRFFSNAASGRMGIALANEAARLGARVILILGPTPANVLRPVKRVRVIPVTGALEMDRQVQKHLPGTKVFIGAAAVSDYRPAAVSRQKIKGKSAAVLLKLVRNPDIIAKVARARRGRPALVIGFALETQDLMKNAALKLKHKDLDWVLANRETNLGTSEGSVTLLSRWYERIPLGPMPKKRLARHIWQAVLERPAL
jgi:phosphopantothenoylcysteine decarboxylase/phosphopantothenate--cysteine ligase